MAALATIHVTMTPELREAIDHIAPVAKASADLFACLSEHGGDMHAPECAQQMSDWEAMTVNFISYRNREDTSE